MSLRTPILLLLALVCALVAVAPAAASTSFAVNDAGDADDASPGDGSCLTAGAVCTLRAAFTEANGQPGNGPFTVTFNLPAGTTIATSGGISGAAGKQFAIDGCQGAPGNDPCVGVRSTTSAPILGLQASSTVSGLAISSSGNASEGVLASSGALTLKRSWLGIGLDGLAGPLVVGARVVGDDSVVGGTTPAERNVFANDTTGLRIDGADNVTVRGNYFGTNKDGTAANQNGNPVSGNGTNVQVAVNGAAVPENTVIGGTLDATALATPECDSACNLISRATSAGITLQVGPPAGATTIAGNYVGVSLDGTAALPNASYGVNAGNAGPVTIGGPAAGDRNVIAGGGAYGIIEGASGGILTIRNNRLGTNAAGTAALPFVNAAAALGGLPQAPTTLRDNVIAHAIGTGSAVALQGEATVTGNSIGVGTGGQNLPMGAAIRVTGLGSVIGGTGPGDANVIGNSKGVAAISVDAGRDNTIVGNLIGVDGNGVARPNHSGVRIRTNFGGTATGNVIGGDQAAEENVISNSVNDAVVVSGAGAGNAVLRNRGTANGQQFVDVGAQGATDALGNGPGNPGAENGGALAPQIAGTPSTLEASGTAAPNATVRVFVTASADGAEPNGITSFVGNATADGAGAWSLTYPSPLPDGTRIAATQTLADGSTGELTQARTVVDATPPETTIDDGPSGVIANATPAWAFSSEPGATFECRVDGEPFAPCSSPYTAAALPDGDHTFEVRARDNSPAQNADLTPATRTVTVDTTAPGTSIAAGPGGPTSDATPTFALASDDGGASFECQVDGGAYVPCGATFTTAALADGAHTVQVRARDAVGNVDATPATRAFVVDTRGPAVTIVGGKLRATRKGAVRLTLSCPASELTGPCAGTLKLASAGKVRVASRRVVVSFGAAKVSLSRGARKTVTITLSKANRALLAKLSSVKAKAVLPAKDALGNARTATTAATLLPPK
jgi:hypothetical protein